MKRYQLYVHIYEYTVNQASISESLSKLTKSGSKSASFLNRGLLALEIPLDRLVRSNFAVCVNRTETTYAAKSLRGLCESRNGCARVSWCLMAYIDAIRCLYI